MKFNPKKLVIFLLFGSALLAGIILLLIGIKVGFEEYMGYKEVSYLDGQVCSTETYQLKIDNENLITDLKELFSIFWNRKLEIILIT